MLGFFFCLIKNKKRFFLSFVFQKKIKKDFFCQKNNQQIDILSI